MVEVACSAMLDPEIDPETAAVAGVVGVAELIWAGNNPEENPATTRSANKFVKNNLIAPKLHQNHVKTDN